MRGRERSTSKKIRSGLWARSARNSNSPSTSIATRVAPLRDQQRTAVTCRNSSPRICAGGPAANSARSGMTVRFMERSMRNIVDLAVRIHHFANRVMDLGRNGFRCWGIVGLDGGGTPSGFFGRRQYIAYRRARLSRAGQPLAHLGHVVLCLRKWGHAAVAGNRAFAGIVGRQGQRLVSLVQPQEILQVTRATLDVVGGIENVGYAESAGGGGNQLHQALRSLRGDRVGIVVAFHLNDGMDEARRKLVLLGDAVHGLGYPRSAGQAGRGNRGGARRCASSGRACPEHGAH